MTPCALTPNGRCVTWSALRPTRPGWLQRWPVQTTPLAVAYRGVQKCALRHPHDHQLIIMAALLLACPARLVGLVEGRGQLTGVKPSSGGGLSPCHRRTCHSPAQDTTRYNSRMQGQGRCPWQGSCTRPPRCTRTCRGHWNWCWVLGAGGDMAVEVLGAAGWEGRVDVRTGHMAARGPPARGLDGRERVPTVAAVPTDGVANDHGQADPDRLAVVVHVTPKFVAS